MSTRLILSSIGGFERQTNPKKALDHVLTHPRLRSLRFAAPQQTPKLPL
ncbi:MAG: hypothetical protein LBU45_09180 [Azoarcus sp.]|jgi:hypothetical protein|nr:hypothetical protein [Azoarcus sp.]